MLADKKVDKWIFFSAIALVFLIGLYYFYFRIFPIQQGEWVKNSPTTEEMARPTFGWEDGVFWTALDFPGKQNICLEIQTSPNISRLPTTLPVVQTVIVALFPTAGTVSDLFSDNTLEKIEENIILGKPYLLNNWPDQVTREDKSILFQGKNNKFLIPTRRIFSAYFPQLDIPASSEQTSSQNYSSAMINYPEGTLLSDGEGVFAMSERQLFLIKSPPVFEALGYKWEDIRQMDEFEREKNQYKQSNSLDFGAYHPNGTLIHKNGEYFFVWLNKKYRLSQEEAVKYFPAQPLIAVQEKSLQANCKQSGKAVTCCMDNFDPRRKPPAYSPFSNTAAWDLSQVAGQKDVEQIKWQSQITVNKENTWRRIGSLKNYLLYTLDFAK